MSFTQLSEPFTSALSVTHTISHTRNTVAPEVTVFESTTGELIIPVSIKVVDPNTVTVDLFVARAIYGMVR